MIKGYLFLFFAAVVSLQLLGQEYNNGYESDCSQLDSYSLLFHYGNSQKECAEMGANLTARIRNNPEDPDYFFLRGMNRSRLKDNRGAIEDYNQALSILKTVHGITDVIGLLYVNTYLAKSRSQGILGDFQEALESANNAMSVATIAGSGPLLLDKIYYYQGATHVYLGNLDLGCNLFSKAGENGCAQAFIAINELCQ